MSEPAKVDSDGWQKWNLNDRVRARLTTPGMRLLIEQDERLHIPQKEECRAQGVSSHREDCSQRPRDKP